MVSRSLENRRPAFIVGSNDTAISTAWCLVDAGVAVRLFILDPPDIGRHSRRVDVVDLTALGTDRHRICERIALHASREQARPVLLPCGDPESIMVATHRTLLEPHCCMHSLTLDELLAVVRKDRLYTAARRAGVEIPATTIAPPSADLTDWLERTPPPFLAKPYYLGYESSALNTKNRVFHTADELLDFTRIHGTSALIIQQLIPAGDGAIFDCYGYCDRRGRILTKASHRRIRQQPIHRGVTSFGEIPSRSVPESEQAVFALTDRLLSAVRYHGIFGIEWALCRRTKRYYLLDFNARPFLTIRHLRDCGLNLPLLAYLELSGEDISTVPSVPRLEHKYWLDLAADIRSFHQHREEKALSFRRWLASLFMSRSFSVLSLRDPIPSAIRALEVLRSPFEFVFRKLL